MDEVLDYDHKTGQAVVREITEDEISQIEAQRLTFEQAKAEKSSARTALLARLGITEEEAKLLLGGN